MNLKKGLEISQKIEFLGVEFNFEAKTVSAENKISEMKPFGAKLINSVEKTNTWSFDDVEKLLGKIEFIAIAHKPARSHTFFLYKLKNSMLKHNFSRINIIEKEVTVGLDQETISAKEFQELLLQEIQYFIDLKGK